MKSLVLAAGLLAAVATSPALAADLGEGPGDRYGGPAYEDPRYADIYRYPEGRQPPRGPVYGERYDERDEYYDPRRYAGRSYQGNCVPREVIRHRLQEQGWNDFRFAEAHGEFATLIARRPSGRPFELTVHRCSGDIVNLRRLDGRHYGPYAYGPRRGERPYY